MDKKILWQRVKKSYFLRIAFVGLVIILLLTYMLPLFLPWDPIENSLAERFLPPDGFSKGLQGHILGTDALGRDMLMRLCVGGQFSFWLAMVCLVITMAVGITLGLLSGYVGGFVDTLIMRLCDAALAIPSLVLSMAIMAVLGRTKTNLVVSMTIFSWTNICRVTRNNVRVVKHQEFISASKVLGAKLPHIMFRQIFPNVTTNLFIQGSQRIGATITQEAGLSYLNLGIAPPTPSWGSMISGGRQYLAVYPWMIMAPGAFLFLSVMTFNFLGDGLRDVLDTKRKI